MRPAIRMFVLVASFAITLPGVAQITVTGADPSSAAQGTNLDVTISGNGFKRGAKAAFHVSGTTNNGGVTVNSTSFSSGSSLTANISISSDADISNYDVEVMNSDGRTGVGSEAFAVVQSRGPVSTTTTIDNYNGATPYVLQSDGNSSASYTADLVSANSGVTHYELDLSLSHSRFFVVTLVPLDNNSAAAAPFVGTMVLSDATIFSRCFTPEGALQDWTQIQPGYPDVTCAMRVEFSYKRVTYGLVMSPEHPGTGTATVSCTQTSSNLCVAWTDVPNSSAANPNVAFLLDTNGNYIGSYSMTFNITVTSP